MNPKIVQVGLDVHRTFGRLTARDAEGSPTHITEVLRYMFNHPQRDVFVGSLATSWRDGTLKKRMRDLAGQVHAKTGYVSGARTLSGYVSDRNGQAWACFAILFNGIPAGKTSTYSALQDDVVRQIARWLERRGPSGVRRLDAALQHRTTAAIPARPVRR